MKSIFAAAALLLTAGIVTATDPTVRVKVAPQIQNACPNGYCPNVNQVQVQQVQYVPVQVQQVQVQYVPVQVQRVQVQQVKYVQVQQVQQVKVQQVKVQQVKVQNAHGFSNANVRSAGSNVQVQSAGRSNISVKIDNGNRRGILGRIFDR